MKIECENCKWFRPKSKITRMIEGQEVPVWPKNGCARYPAKPVMLIIPGIAGQMATVVDWVYHGTMPEGACGEYAANLV